MLVCFIAFGLHFTDNVLGASNESQSNRPAYLIHTDKDMGISFEYPSKFPPFSTDVFGGKSCVENACISYSKGSKTEISQQIVNTSTKNLTVGGKEVIGFSGASDGNGIFSGITGNFLSTGSYLIQVSMDGVDGNSQAVGIQRIEAVRDHIVSTLKVTK